MLTKEETRAAGYMAAKSKMIRAPCMDIAMCSCYTDDKAPIDADVFAAWYEGYDNDRHEYLEYKREIMEMDEQSAAKEAAKEDD